MSTITYVCMLLASGRFMPTMSSASNSLATPRCFSATVKARFRFFVLSPIVSAFNVSHSGMRLGFVA